MFDDLRAHFRKAVENFNEELNRDEFLEKADDLIDTMKNEVTEATSHINALELQISKARDQVAEVGHAAETCYRQAEMAHHIGDTETTTVATQYAEKHEEHVRVLNDKIDALNAEILFLEEEVEEMVEKVEKAEATGTSLSIDSVPSRKHDSISPSK